MITNTDGSSVQSPDSVPPTLAPVIKGRPTAGSTAGPTNCRRITPHAWCGSGFAGWRRWRRHPAPLSWDHDSAGTAGPAPRTGYRAGGINHRCGHGPRRIPAWETRCHQRRRPVRCRGGVCSCSSIPGRTASRAPPSHSARQKPLRHLSGDQRTPFRALLWVNGPSELSARRCARRTDGRR